MKKYMPLSRHPLAWVWLSGLCAFSVAGWQEKLFVRCLGPVSAGCGVGKFRCGTARSSKLWGEFHWCTRGFEIKPLKFKK